MFEYFVADSRLQFIQEAFKKRHCVIHQKMASKEPLNNIDDITDIMELLQVFRLLGISYGGENYNIAEMKKKAKEEIQRQRSEDGEFSKHATTVDFIYSTTICRRILVRPF